jgi:hypothetical protein
MSHLTSKQEGIEALRRGASYAACYLLTEAVRQDPADAQTLGYLGIAWASENQPERALECLAAAARLDPQSAPLQHNLGIALEQAGRLADALAAYQRAMLLDPGYQRAVFAFQRLAASPEPAITNAGAACGGSFPPVPAALPTARPENVAPTAGALSETLIAASASPQETAAPQPTLSVTPEPAARAPEQPLLGGHEPVEPARVPHLVEETAPVLPTPEPPPAPVLQVAPTAPWMAPPVAPPPPTAAGRSGGPRKRPDWLYIGVCCPVVVAVLWVGIYLMEAGAPQHVPVLPAPPAVSEPSVQAGSALPEAIRPVSQPDNLQPVDDTIPRAASGPAPPSAPPPAAARPATAAEVETSPAPDPRQILARVERAATESRTFEERARQYRRFAELYASTDAASPSAAANRRAAAYLSSQAAQARATRDTARWQLAEAYLKEARPDDAAGQFRQLRDSGDSASRVRAQAAARLKQLAASGSQRTALGTR